jgi:TPR repeat protein
MKRVEANDAASICVLGDHYFKGLNGFEPNRTKAIELFSRAGDLGLSKGHYLLAEVFRQEGEMKKAKFYLEAAAMAGNEMARTNLGGLEAQSGNMERAVKHFIIAASAGCFDAMHTLIRLKKGYVTRESLKSTLKAYNNSCFEMRSEARDGFIRRGIPVSR